VFIQSDILKLQTILYNHICSFASLPHGSHKIVHIETYDQLVITRNVSLPKYWSGFEAITGIMPFFAGMPLYYALYYVSRITRAAQIR
jgi:hypothetical protein